MTRRAAPKITRRRLVLELQRSGRAPVIVGLGLVVAIVSVGLLISRMNVRLPGQHDYVIHVAVDSARGVTPGKQEVRWAGVVVGRITAVQLRGGRTAVLTATIDPSKAGGKTYHDARLRLRPQTALEDMYLDIENRGHPDTGALGGHDVLAAARTETAVSVGEVLDAFPGNVRDRTREALVELGRGLPDGGAQLRSAFVSAVPWLQAQAHAARELGRRKATVSRLVRNVRLLSGELAQRDTAITELLRAGSAAFQRVANQSPALDEALRQFPATVSKMHVSFTRLQGVLGDVRPALVALRPAARALPAGLTALRNISSAGVPAFASLEHPLTSLRPLARALAPMSASLASGLRHLDPQLPTVQRATQKVSACETWIQKFFSLTLSVFKLGNASDRTAFPRGILVQDAGAVATEVRDPFLKRIPLCGAQVKS